MRVPEFTDEEIIRAGEALEAEYRLQAEATGKRPRRVTGTAICSRLGAGKPARATQIWLSHVAARDGANQEPLRLPDDLHGKVQGNLDAIYRLIAQAERDMRAAAGRGSEEYVRDLLADNDALRAESETADAALRAEKAKVADLERRVADLEGAVAAKDAEIGRLTDRVAEVLDERDSVVSDLQRRADEQRQRADDAEAQAAAFGEAALSSRVAAVAAEGARKTAQAALRRLGDEAAGIREHLSGIRANGVAPELDALQRLAYTAWAAADASPAADIPEGAAPAEPPPVARKTRRRAEPQPET